ncbi:MAG: hypothetical protein ACRC57_10935 [Sarcina sp.]
MNSGVDILVSSELRIYRNIQNIQFPSKLRNEEGKEIAEKISQIFLKNSKYKFKRVNLWQKSKEDIISFIENNIISSRTLKNRMFSTILFTDDNTTVIVINDENHIKILLRKIDLKLEDLYKKAEELLFEVSKELKFAYSKDYGYLTSSPKTVGTGVKAREILHLPILNKIGAIDDLIVNLEKISITLKPIFKIDNRAYGNLYKIENKITIGILEKNIFTDVDAIVQQLILKEKKARTVLKDSGEYELKDSIFRARGIIQNARKITFSEVLDLTSMLRLGIEMKFLNNLTSMDINNSILIAKKETIKKTGKMKNTLQGDIKRANEMRKIYKNI